MKIVNTKPLLKVEELEAFLVYAGLPVKINQEIFFELHETGQVIATYTLSFDPDKDINIDLVVDYDDAGQLIKAHGLTTVEGLNKITLADLWLRYLAGNGYVCTDLAELDAEICFRIVKRITMVYSADLSFYQEIPHALSMTYQFEKYIDENMYRFEVAAGMRPLLLPEEVWVP